MPSKCSRIGHNYQQLKSNLAIKNVKREKCLDCGHEETFSVHSWDSDKRYAEAHKRDFIQPWQTEEWNLAYPDKKVITDLNRRTEMGEMLQSKMGKERKAQIAEEYVRSFGWFNEEMQKILRWHLGA